MNPYWYAAFLLLAFLAKFVAAAIVGAMIHEQAHALCLRRAGAKVKVSLFNTDYEFSQPPTKQQSIIILAAGPVAGSIWALMLWALSGDITFTGLLFFEILTNAIPKSVSLKLIEIISRYSNVSCDLSSVVDADLCLIARIARGENITL